MKIVIKKILHGLRAHTVIDGYIVASNGYCIYKVNYQGSYKKKINTIPSPLLKRILSKNRIISRAYRLGISQIKRTFNDKVIIFSNRNLLLSNLQFSEFKKINIPIRSFQLMDHNICVTNNYIYYSEYFPNFKRDNSKIEFLYQCRPGLSYLR